MIHLFIGARDTLCGKTLVPRSDRYGWGSGYKRCQHCERLRLAKLAEQQAAIESALPYHECAECPSLACCQRIGFAEDFEREEACDQPAEQQGGEEAS